MNPPLGWAAMVVTEQDEWQVAEPLTAVADGPSQWHGQSWPHLSILTGVTRVFRCCFVPTAPTHAPREGADCAVCVVRRQPGTHNICSH